MFQSGPGMRPPGPPGSAATKDPTMFDIRFHVQECQVLKHSELFFPVRRTKLASLPSSFCPTATCSLINAFTIEQHYSGPKRLGGHLTTPGAQYPANCTINNRFRAFICVCPFLSHCPFL